MQLALPSSPQLRLPAVCARLRLTPAAAAPCRTTEALPLVVLLLVQVLLLLQFEQKALP